MPFKDGIFGNMFSRQQQQSAPQQQSQSQPQNQQQNSGQPPAQVNGNGSAGPIGRQQAPANPAADPNTMQGQQAPQNQNNAGGPENPMDRFSSYFAPRQQDPNAQKPVTIADPYLPDMDIQQFQQQTANMNFASSVPDELLQKAASGDISALREALNTVGREGFHAASAMAHGLSNAGARAAAERVSGTIDSRVRDHQIRTQNPNHEALRHPSTAPVLNAIKAQIAARSPGMAPADVQKEAEDFFVTMATAINASNNPGGKEGKGNEPQMPDFSHYLSSN